jgi:hypothetical protein
VVIDQAIQMGFHLVERGARAVFDRQVKEEMAMHDIGMGFALPTPDPYSGDAAANQNLG